MFGTFWLDLKLTWRSPFWEDVGSRCFLWSSSSCNSSLMKTFHQNLPPLSMYIFLSSSHFLSFSYSSQSMTSMPGMISVFLDPTSCSFTVKFFRHVSSMIVSLGNELMRLMTLVWAFYSMIFIKFIHSSSGRLSNFSFSSLIISWDSIGKFVLYSSLNCFPSHSKGSSFLGLNFLSYEVVFGA